MNWDTAPQELDDLRAQVAALTKVADAANELIAYSDTGGDDKPYPYIFWDDKFKALEVALKELGK
jgi:hypothetical protein